MPGFVEEFPLRCLSQVSYLAGSRGEALVVNPRREIGVYLEAALRRSVRIRYIVLTRSNPDLFSGHMELARRTGATIYVGAGSGAAFPHVAAADGMKLQVGGCELEFMATTGRDGESLCAAWIDPEISSDPLVVFQGEALIAGRIRRTDEATLQV